jgi:hypothetical protein
MNFNGLAEYWNFAETAFSADCACPATAFRPKPGIFAASGALESLPVTREHSFLGK